MDISNPRRILLVGPSDAPILDLLQDLTGTKPSTTNHPTLAGLSHSLPIKTPYYTSTIPIWIDTPPAPSSAANFSTWSIDFRRPEAREVLGALGAFVVCFRKPSADADFALVKALLDEVSRVVKACEAMPEGWDGVCVAVGLRREVLPGLEVAEAEWEDVCGERGFEYVDGEVKGAGGRNTFGEKTGIARLKEALEANDWATNEDVLELDDFDDVEDEASMGFGVEAAELEMEMFGMKQAIYGIGDQDGEEDEEDGGGVGHGAGKGRNGEKKVEGGNEDEEDEVEKLEALMLRMQAVRDMGANLPEAERKRFASRAVKDIMKTL